VCLNLAWRECVPCRQKKRGETKVSPLLGGGVIARLPDKKHGNKHQFKQRLQMQRKPAR